MSKKKLGFINKIFYNNKYLFVFSIILAIIIWVSVVMEFSPETTYVISDVPVKVSTSETSAGIAGLKPFGTEDLKVDVTISGPRYSIRTTDVSSDNFKVEAIISNVTSVGYHTLQLKASIVDKSATYTIKSVSKDSINVYFDNYTREKVLPLELKGVPQTNLAVEGTYCEGAVLSQNTITVSGATYQINELGDKIYATFDSSKLSFPLKETANFDVDILLQDENGNKLQFVNIVDNVKITGTIPVLEIKNLDTSVSFKNVPKTSGISMPSNISYTISPSSVDAAAAKDVLGSMNMLDVGVIDFREVAAGTNIFTFKVEDITSAKVVEDIEEFTVTVNASNVSSAVMSIPIKNAEITNVPSGYKASLVEKVYSIENVTFVGPLSTIENLDADDIKVTVDLNGISEVSEGNHNVNAIISINQNGVWAYGKYNVSVKLFR